MLAQAPVAAPPVARGEAAATRGATTPPKLAAAPPPALSVHPGKALLVEDDAGWRAILAELLADAGYSVHACLSYGEALGHLRREKHSLVVADLSLANSLAAGANRDGFEVLREAKAAGIPAIVVSGLATPADLERLYSEFAVFACLEKQRFERSGFVTAVQEATSAKPRSNGEVARLTLRAGGARPAGARPHQQGHRPRNGHFGEHRQALPQGHLRSSTWTITPQRSQRRCDRRLAGRPSRITEWHTNNRILSWHGTPRMRSQRRSPFAYSRWPLPHLPTQASLPHQPCKPDKMIDGPATVHNRCGCALISALPNGKRHSA